MIKSLHTSLARLTVIAFYVNFYLTIDAIDQFMLLIFLIDFQNKIVNRITAGDIEVVVRNRYKKAIGHRNQYP